ncbi:hypothetical protein TcYC6_0048850 [Trypanosoma cruzi]|nr:hypothetical protein TcYC6_0048850 [Trypanosoma cruzi]
MYEAAEQQLALVSRKTHRLGEVLRQQIDALKELRTARMAAFAERDELRQRLRVVEERANAVDCKHNEAECCLRRTAEEFAATQLLQKQYENTLAELKGRQRVVVRVAGAAPRSGGPAWEEASRDEYPKKPPQRTQEKQQQQREGEEEERNYRARIAVTDECTVVDLDRRRTFVVDLAYAMKSLRRRMPSESALAAASGISSAPAASEAIPAEDTTTQNFMIDEDLFATLRLEHVIADVLSGVNMVFLSFGPAGAGKTETLFGTKAAIIQHEMLQKRGRQQQQQQQQQSSRHSRCSGSNGRGMSVEVLSKSPQVCGATAGLLSLFVHGLFDSLVSHAVTHVSISCSFVELAMNQTVDLLLRQPGRPVSGSGGNNTTLVKMFSAAAGSASTASISCGGPGEEVTAVRAETAEEVMRLFFEGLDRLGRWRRSFPSFLLMGDDNGSNTNGPQPKDEHVVMAHRGGVSHAIFALRVENFNDKGHYRRSMVSFVDLCGPPPSGAGSVMRPLTPEEQWVDESLQAVCDAIAATSSVKPNEGKNAAERAGAAFDQLPSSHTNCMARFLRPIFGGNAKATLVCCVDVEMHSKEQVLNAISYAYFFKRIQHQAVPYDIPPELQRLNLQLSAFLSGEGGDDDGEDEDNDNDVMTSSVGLGTARNSLAPVDANWHREGYSRA